MNSSSANEYDTPISEFSKIRSHFDLVLSRHIVSLLEDTSEEPAVSFDLASISCILLLAERENEISNFPASPPERYTRETFLNDLSGLGLPLDEDLMASFQQLIQFGYVDTDNSGRFLARKPAMDMVRLLDNLFPGIPGLSFAAYIIQTIEEVVSGRKHLAEGLRQFDQSLLNRGIASTKRDKTQDRRQSATANSFATAPNRQTFGRSVEAEKRTNLEKLSRIRSKSERKVSDGSIVTTQFSRNIKIKEIFPSTAGQPEKSPSPITAAGAEDSPTVIPAAEKIPQPEEAAAAADYSSQTDPLEKDALPETAPEFNAPEKPILQEGQGVDPTQECQETAIEIADSTVREETATEAADGESSLPMAETVIDEQVLAFEEELAISCPVCKAGRIRMERTEKGREYYLCAAENCRFISWGKPYHFSCPLCSNAYLVEFAHPAGMPGLRCPRATCSFRQEGVESPRALKHPPLEAATFAGAGQQPRKKRRRVLRKVVRKK